jgi:hypothetical protein
MRTIHCFWCDIILSPEAAYISYGGKIKCQPCIDLDNARKDT